jgi:hypothetical protein
MREKALVLAWSQLQVHLKLLKYLNLAQSSQYQPKEKVLEQECSQMLRVKALVLAQK